MTTRLDNVSVLTKSNVYFDGKCVSHTVQCADGSRKTVGVIFPATLTFTTGAPERMEITAGRCRVKLAKSGDWLECPAGSTFEVAADSRFEIEVTETVDYVCHFG